jgi:cytochrome c3-like protein
MMTTLIAAIANGAKNLFCRATMLAALLVCGGSIIVALAQDAGPKRLPDVAANNCAGCHTAKSPFRANHPVTANMDMAGCRRCHGKGRPAALSGRIPLSHTHMLSGVTCATCHADVKDPEPVKAEACLNCHAGETVAAASTNVKPTNPHNSPHYGKESDCNLCHHQHEKSENYCTQCHKFEFKVP